MAKKLRKRGPTLEDKYIGLKPSYGDHNPVPTDPKEIDKEYMEEMFGSIELENVSN